MAEIVAAKQADSVVTMAAEALPIAAFCRELSLTSGVSIVFDENLEGSVVTLDVQEQTVNDVLSVVARRFGTQVTRTGNLYFLGNLRPEDRGVFVGRLSVGRDDTQSIAQLLLSENGRASVTANGVAVVADTVEVLTRVSEAFELVNAQVPNTWLVQFHVLRTTSAAEKSASIVTEFLARFDWFAEQSLTLTAASSFDSVRANSATETVAEPLLVLVDGVEASIVSGSKIPLQDVVTNGETGQTSQSVRFEDVGFSLRTTLNSLGGDSAMLTVDLKDETLSSRTDGLPEISGLTITANSAVVSGSTYLLARQDRIESGDGRGLGSRIEWFETSKHVETRVFCRVYRVGDPIESIELPVLAVPKIAEASAATKERAGNGNFSEVLQ